MPQSLVLHLVTQSSVIPKHLQGYSLQQLFFNLVDAVDPELGHVLRRDENNRSYSLSALQIKSPASHVSSRATSRYSHAASRSIASRLRLLKKAGQKTEQKTEQTSTKNKQVSRALQPTFAALQYAHYQAILARTECWWRISFLDDDLFDHLIFLWNQLGDEVFPLGPAHIKVVNIAREIPGLNWAASCSYRDIYEQASAQERDIHFKFVTPTAFELGDSITPLPTADAIFQSLRKHWNRYSGLVFAPSLISDIVPTRFDLKTETVQSALRSSLQTFTGCTGSISFRIGGQVDPLIIKRINALADFAQYCGIGAKTRFGMGVIRRIDGCLESSHQSDIKAKI